MVSTGIATLTTDVDVPALMAEPSYTALAKLLERGENFGFIFIDGYRSFDYAFVDSRHLSSIFEP